LKKKVLLFLIPFAIFAVIIIWLIFIGHAPANLVDLYDAMLIAGWALSIVELILLRKEKKKGTVSKLLKAAYVIDMIALIWSSLLAIQLIPSYIFYAIVGT
jgi:hypothetical protein